jgi:hypothetical protein
MCGGSVWLHIGHFTPFDLPSPDDDLAFRFVVPHAGHLPPLAPSAIANFVLHSSQTTFGMALLR